MYPILMRVTVCIWMCVYVYVGVSISDSPAKLESAYRIVKKKDIYVAWPTNIKIGRFLICLITYFYLITVFLY